MKVCVFIILMVIQTMTCEKAVSKLRRKLMVPKMNEKCKKIKCAAVDDPQCVRMRRHDLRLTFHIIAANKCELNYVKCHDDVEAKIVPMKYCSHNADQTAGKKINKTGKPQIRVKRRVKSDLKAILRQGESSTTERRRTGFKDNNNKTKEPTLKKSRMNSKKLSLKWKNEDSNIISKDRVPNGKPSIMKSHGAEHHARQSMAKVVIKHRNYPFSSETDSDLENNERKKINKGVAGHLLGVEEEDADSTMQQLQLQPKAFKPPSMLTLKGNSLYPLSHQIQATHFWGSKELGPEFPMLSEEAANISKESLTSAERQQYEELCPTTCPSRDVMVCGRCHHGIYKTFISVCHLRMFACNHQDEIMQLVSRYPCVMSDPYIAETNPQKGRITEPDDDDKVLRFIMCRDQGKLGTDEKPPGDPRCNFRASKDKLKYYDFKGVNMHLESHQIQHKESSEY